MKKFYLFCLAAVLSVAASAQRAYFLYLQTDDQAPFYVRMSDKVYSSSTAGYLILPNLTDSTYAFALGFAKSTQPETRFAVTINQTDKGYLVKKFTEGLGLFDLQNLSIVKPTTAANDNTVYETRSDKFSAILSKAADDPSLLKVPVAKKEEPKVEPEKTHAVVVKNDEPKKEEKPVDPVTSKPVETIEKKTEKSEEPIVKADTLISQPEVKSSEEPKQTVVKEETLPDVSLSAYKLSVVTRRSESSTTEGLGIVYFDKSDEKVDTIRILIPPSKIRVEDSVQINDLPEAKAEEKPISELQPPPQANTEVKSEKSVIATVISANCINNASDKDFMKLRKNMAAKSNDEEMVAEARKVFKNKCFTTEQLRYLSTLFLTSAAKYQFFDAAYNYVSDKQNFSSLQSEIKDEYYLKRFKALIGE